MKNPFGFRFVAPLALGSMLNPINSTMLATALVPIADSLHTSVADTGWLIAGLYMTSAVAQPTMGRLVDLFGPRRIYLLSLVFVAAAGILGQGATSLATLLVVRVLLGIGTSGAYPAAMKLFREQADRTGAPAPRTAMGVLSLAAVSSAAAGPLLGGLLTSAFGWQSIFTVNVPLSLVAMALVLLWVPRDGPRSGRFLGRMKQVDLLGVALFTGSLLALMTFLMNLNQFVWPALLASAGLGALLAVHSLRRIEPFLDVRMLVRNGPLSVTYLRVLAVTTVVYCIFYGFAPWLESAVGLSSAHAGLVLLPLSVVAAASSLSGVRTRGLRVPFLISIGAAVAGCLALFFLDSATPVWLIAGAVMLFGVPQGAFSTATQAAIYLQAPAAEIGAAAGLQRTAAYIGAVVAAGLLSLLYGQRPTDASLHSLALVLGIASTILFVATLFDRTIPSFVTEKSPHGPGQP